MRKSVILIALLAFTGQAAGQDREPDLGTEEQREAGRTLYIDKCAQCHGMEGAGDGEATPYLRPAPRDFTAGIFKVRSTASGDLPTDDDLKKVIREGMPYTGMPPWPRLSRREVQNLIYHIKTYNDFFAGAYGVPDPIDMPDLPRFSEDRLERGRQVYEANQCNDCHGQQGRGDGPSAPTLQDQWDHHIRPADLTKRWTFVGGSTRRDILRTFLTGLDGTPMPSYDIPPEDQIALVDYVYSLSRDRPDYAALVISRGTDEPIDVTRGKDLVGEPKGALFPVVGQIIEPGRTFMPGVNAIEVWSVYNGDEIAFVLSWHDMSAETSGENGLTLPGPEIEEVVRDTAASPYSDAVAIQLPAQASRGNEKPYLLFGDAKRPAEIWFSDLATGEAGRFQGRGSGDIQERETDLEFYSNYEHGEWTAVFKSRRTRDGDERFAAERFVPVAFSVWDGFNHERGNSRGLTSWYHVYVEPMDRPSAVIPMLTYGLMTLALMLGVVGIVRRKYRAPVSA